MMNAIRPAGPDDADEIAALHMQAWRETDTGILPPDEIARNGLSARRALWRRVLGAG
ncbi:hypothetical protein ROJ8625_01537 [Roseivivax jejudonensis]|uniref:GNAT family N-acetyltransferase n=1 Tax=Roseivivax jejudonensis TaxID=1529041 RepID=A0A1X6YW06_9RHOB|nr:hypothetical protein [Roseivivax jejudonensis]SLN32868.1 hypothetical protein ROJ8625_01537 [Roseivivax jejudonensis]